MKQYDLSNHSERQQLYYIIKFFIKSFDLNELDLVGNRVARRCGYKVNVPVAQME